METTSSDTAPAEAAPAEAAPAEAARVYHFSQPLQQNSGIPSPGKKQPAQVSDRQWQAAAEAKACPW